MKSIKYKLVKYDDSCIGYNYIIVIGRFLFLTEERYNCDNVKLTFYKYKLDCLCPHGYEQIYEDEFQEELCSGIYVFDSVVNN